MPCVAAGSDPIATDRPDFVESSATVGDGRIQIETSTAWDRSEEAGLREEVFATPTLLRVGVAENWELRLESDGWLRRTVRDAVGRESDSGMADVSIGAKYHVAGSGENGPSLAWLIHADLATGARAFAGHGVRPSVRLVAEWELPNDMSLGVMPGVIRDDDGNGHGFTAGIFGVVVGKGWTSRFRTFAELAAPQITSKRNGGDVLLLDLGGAYLLDDNTQLDIAASAGLTDESPDRALTIGFSRRW
jgi:hypothetical protein